MRRDYDVVVVGGGTAGSIAAIAAARQGARTCLIEANGHLGGTCHALANVTPFHNSRGEAVVAGLAAGRNVSPRDIDITELRGALRAQHAII